jgi:acyl-[acyl carrier protein]--UDP-N-acetylglucosamine O-acyltransferase
MAKIANVALTDTFNTWRTRTNTVLDRVSQFAINNSSLYANTLTSNVAFTSKGLATFNGRATVGTNLTVSGNTTITGLTTMSGRATVGTNLTVSGNTTLGGASKTVTIGGTSSTLTIGGTGHVSNTTGWFGVTGRASVSTNLFVGANTVVNGRLGIGIAAPAYNLDISSGSAQFPVAMTINPTTHATSRRAAMYLGGWLINQDSAGSGVKDFAIYDSVASASRFTISTGGLVYVQQSTNINQNLTVSGNTTLGGTINVASANILQQTLSDGATVNWNVALGQIATVTLGGNRTMAAPTNLKVGTYILHIYQDGTGSRTITWNAVFKWTAATAPPLTSAINSHDVFSFVSDGTNLYGSFMPDVR